MFRQENAAADARSAAAFLCLLRCAVQGGATLRDLQCGLRRYAPTVLPCSLVCVRFIRSTPRCCTVAARGHKREAVGWTASDDCLDGQGVIVDSISPRAQMAYSQRHIFPQGMHLRLCRHLTMTQQFNVILCIRWRPIVRADRTENAWICAICASGKSNSDNLWEGGSGRTEKNPYEIRLYGALMGHGANALAMKMESIYTVMDR